MIKEKLQAAVAAALGDAVTEAPPTQLPCSASDIAVISHGSAAADDLQNAISSLKVRCTPDLATFPITPCHTDGRSPSATISCTISACKTPLTWAVLTAALATRFQASYEALQSVQFWLRVTSGHGLLQLCFAADLYTCESMYAGAFRQCQVHDCFSNCSSQRPPSLSIS